MSGIPNGQEVQEREKWTEEQYMAAWVVANSIESDEDLLKKTLRDVERIIKKLEEETQYGIYWMYPK